MKRSMQDCAQSLLQAPVQIKGVQCRPLISELALARGVHLRAPQQSFAGCERLVVSAFDLRPLAALLLQFCRRQEVVVQRLPALSVERVDWLDQLRVPQSIV